MKDHEQRTVPASGAWETAEIAKNFVRYDHEIRDIAHGPGRYIRFPVGEDGSHRHLELYPDAKVVRLRTADIRVEIFRAAPPRVEKAGVVFPTEDGEGRVILLYNGHVVVDIPPTVDARPGHATKTEGATSDVSAAAHVGEASHPSATPQENRTVSTGKPRKRRRVIVFDGGELKSIGYTQKELGGIADIANSTRPWWVGPPEEQGEEPAPRRNTRRGRRPA